MTAMARPRPLSTRSSCATSGLIRYAKKIANRKAISVARATYKKPSTSANSSTVTRTRAVRESASDNKFSRVVSVLPPGLVPDYFRVIGRNRHLHQLELVVIIHPQCPVHIVALEIQPQQIAFGAPDVDLLGSNQFHANVQRGAILRHQHSEVAGYALALQSSALLLAVRCQVAPRKNLAMDKKVVVQDH